jgi:C4-dicarboxylate transporter DctM subunit
LLILGRPVPQHALARSVRVALLSSARMSISIGMLIAARWCSTTSSRREHPGHAQRICSRAGPVARRVPAAGQLILLVLGAFLEGSTIILIILPVLLPTATALGIDPVHFGVMAVLNIMIGLVTPPYGLLLFMMTKIANVSLATLVHDVLPFLLVMLGALALVAAWPGMVLWLPRLAGYTG